MKALLLLVTLCSFANASLIDWSKIEGTEVLSGKKYERKDSKKVGVFFFLSSTCPCSDQYFSYLNDLAKKFPNNYYVAFNSSKKMETKQAQDYYKKIKLNFPVLEDKSLKYANIFKASKTPHVFVLNENGNVLYHGGVANSRLITKAKNFYLEDALKDIKLGNKPSKSYARTLGCYIAR